LPIVEHARITGSALDWRFEIVDMDKHRIDKVLASSSEPFARIDAAPVR
jgi:CBS domain containing-hemolysin-like protein